MEKKDENLSRDFFLYLFSTLAILVIASNLVTIIFQVINIAIPDVLRPEPPPYSRDAIRWSIASLIVFFPVYFFVMRFLNGDIRNFPEKAELRARRWLLNLTLFLAAIVIIGDLISLIYNFLQGELTIRFSLKITGIFIIAAGIFSYYRKILRSEELLKRSFIISTFPKITIGVVSVCVVTAFFVAGLPKSRRLVMLDEKRVNDLSSIESQIANYWERNEKLPESLNQLKEFNIEVPVDPKTKDDYGYEITDRVNMKYKLCANFETSNRVSPERAREAAYNQLLWYHEAKYACFERAISKKALKR